MIDYGGISEFSAMVQLNILLIVLCGLVVPARSSELNLLWGEQAEGLQAAQPQKDATIGQQQPCSPGGTNTCRPEEGVKAPIVTYAPDPQYTKLARKQKLSGKTTISMIVGVDGKPSQVHVIRSMAEGLPQELQPAALSLDEKAIEAAQEYRFKPAIYRGKPLAVKVHVEVNFRLR